jgi:hypothetical protein
LDTVTVDDGIFSMGAGRFGLLGAAQTNTAATDLGGWQVGLNSIKLAVFLLTEGIELLLEAGNSLRRCGQSGLRGGVGSQFRVEIAQRVLVALDDLIEGGRCVGSSTLSVGIGCVALGIGHCRLLKVASGHAHAQPTAQRAAKHYGHPELCGGKGCVERIVMQIVQLEGNFGKKCFICRAQKCFIFIFY